MDRGRRAKEVVYGRPYNLQVKISKPDGEYSREMCWGLARRCMTVKIPRYFIAADIC